jgi:uncharacterized protein
MAKDNTLKVITHVLGIFISWLGPLIILLVTKEEDVKQHAKKALNWHISSIIYSFIVYFIIVILLFITLIISDIIIFFPIAIIIGFLFIFTLSIMNIIFCIMATIKASNDELWNYPLAIPFLK